MSTPFEKLMEKSFLEYSSTGVAFLKVLHPRMRVAGKLGNAPAWVQVAKAPFDIDGYYLDNARYIACEVKENGERKVSLPIIGPGKVGTGLQYHQLEALVAVHIARGLACVVWNNAGEIGYLDGTRLKAAKAAIDTSLKAEKEGYPGAKKGSRSILFGNFNPVQVNQTNIPLWLPANGQSNRTGNTEFVSANTESEEGERNGNDNPGVELPELTAGEGDY